MAVWEYYILPDLLIGIQYNSAVFLYSEKTSEYGGVSRNGKMLLCCTSYLRGGVFLSDSQGDKHEGQGHNQGITIIVNARQKEVTQKELSFAQVIALAYDNPPTGPNIIFTVTYRRGEGNKPEGSLVEGETVKVKEGMIFNVTATDKS